MPSTNPQKMRQTKVALAGIFLLGAVWLGWGGWQQRQSKSGEERIQAAHQALVVVAKKEVSSELAKLGKQVDSEVIRVAVVAGDWDGASKALAAGMTGASEVRVVPADLTSAYDDPKISYARLAAMEAALLKRKPYAGATLQGVGLQMAMAAPVIVDGYTVGVAYAQRPLKNLLDAANKTQIDEKGYLALQQGQSGVFKQGDETLATSPNAKRDEIAQSGLSVVSAGPDIEPGPFGMGFLGCMIGASLLLAMGVGVLVVPALLSKRAMSKKTPDQMEAEADYVMPAAVARERTKPIEIPAVETDEAATVAEETPTVATNENAFPRGLGAGAIGPDVDAGSALKLGQAVGQWLHARGINDIAVGRDERASSQALLDGIVQGLVSAGRRVHDVGVAPTPLIAFAGAQLGGGASLCAVGDERTGENTGLLMIAEGKPLVGADLDAIAAGGETYDGSVGSCETVAPMDNYLRKLTDGADLGRAVRVAVSGPHHAELARALQLYGAQISDGTEAEIGLKLGDNGAALYATDRHGEVVPAEKILTLLVTDLLERAPGSEVVCDTATADALALHVLGSGGSMKTAGPTIADIHASMAERGSEMAGDGQGHILINDRAGSSPDGFLAALRLMDVLSYVDHADEALTT